MINLVYIGYKGTNIIGNEKTFIASITAFSSLGKNCFCLTDLYPSITSRDNDFEHKFKNFIINSAKQIMAKFNNVEFVCFNRKIINICKDIPNMKFVCNNNWDTLQLINNKAKMRELLKNDVPIVPELKNINTSCELVAQYDYGEGGNGTFFIKTKTDYESISKNHLEHISITPYIKNIPINITIILCKDKVISFPPSVQLIYKNKNFNYCGADFIYANNFSQSLLNKINSYTFKIANTLQKLGYIGICGIDYIIDKNEQIYFMEVNPRFQGSSFLISQELTKKYNTNLAELNYYAFYKPSKLLDKYQITIKHSFINNDLFNIFDTNTQQFLNNDYQCFYHYKVYNHSVLKNTNFEKLD